MIGSIIALGIGLVPVVENATPQPVLRLERVKAFESDCLVCCATYNPSGSLLAYVNDKGLVVVYDLKHQRRYLSWQVADQKGRWNYRYRLAFSPDGRILATNDAEGVITLWEVSTGERRLSFKAPTPKILSMFFSMDGRSLVTAGKGQGTITIWDATSGKPRIAIQADKEYISAAVLSPNGKSIIGGGSERSLRSWRLVDGKPESLMIKQAGPGFPFDALAVTVDGVLVTANYEVALWSITGKRLAIVDLDYPAIALASSPIDDVVAIGGYKNLNGIILLSVSKPGETWVTRYDSNIRHLAFSPDGKQIVSCDDDGFVIIWNRK